MEAARARFTAPTFNLATLRTNVLSGIVVGIIAFPLSIALAVAVGVPPIAGLYTAITAGAVAIVVITDGILFVIVLVILLGLVKGRGLKDLGDNWFPVPPAFRQVFF